MSASLADVLMPVNITPHEGRVVRGKSFADTNDFTDDDLAGVGATREPGEWVPRPCPQCTNPMPKWSRLCWDCYRVKHRIMERPVLSKEDLMLRYLARKERTLQLNARRAKAAGAVSYAIGTGKLRKLCELSCVDCGAHAFCYDHRDYSKPLEVEPVCKRCDCLRGAAAPYDGSDVRWHRRMLATEKRLAVRGPIEKHWILAIERETGVSRHDLRPDIYPRERAT